MVGSGGGLIAGTTLVYTNNQALPDGYGGFLSFASKGKSSLFLCDRARVITASFSLSYISFHYSGVSDIECFLLHPRIILLSIPTLSISLDFFCFFIPFPLTTFALDGRMHFPCTFLALFFPKCTPMLLFNVFFCESCSMCHDHE